MIDIKKALADPGLVFKIPENVLQNSELSREQKIDILRQWELDARRLQVTDEESTTDGEPAQLGAVLEALRALGAASEFLQGKRRVG
jgi:hypothetical protein